MVGGKVTDVVIRPDRIWVNVQDPIYTDQLGLYLSRNDNSLQIIKGDTIWWQSRNAYWTPGENSPLVGQLIMGVYYDIPIPRLSMAGVRHPILTAIKEARSGAGAF